MNCPKCKSEIIIYCLCSYPAHYEAMCFNCNYSLRYFDRKDSFKKITQDELNKESEAGDE